MPDTLSQESMQEIRDRHPDDTESEVARLLAHIDALTAAVSRVPGMGPGMDYISRAAVLAILGGADR